MEQRPKLGAMAVVLRGPQVLMVQRRNAPNAGLWGFPGGHVELGETAMDAAVRELREETGVTARARGYLTNVDLIERDAEGAIRFHYLLAAVACDYEHGEPVAADDAQAAAWQAVDAVFAGDLDITDRVTLVLEAALRQRQGALR